MMLIRMNYFSKLLGNNHEIVILLPDCPFAQDPSEYYAKKEKYKVLWLLHGTFGDSSDWLRKSLIELYAEERNLAVVMPSAMNSNYENCPEFGFGYRMRDYFFDELMPMVYNRFPVSEKREDNYIAGLSMGGRGTLKFALGHPERFAGAAVLSQCAHDLRKLDPDKLDPRTANDVKRAGSFEAYLNSYENTWDQLRTLLEEGTELPDLYFACGEDDGLYQDFIEFRDYAETLGLKAKFVTEPGYAHEWRFWNGQIEKALEHFGIVKQKAKPF
ncbi:MAG: hypothetical protein K6F23_04730 [Solobacterium sp.]|nr:hypothetical protein [Solobacterium sp.]